MVECMLVHPARNATLVDRISSDLRIDSLWISDMGHKLNYLIRLRDEPGPAVLTRMFNDRARKSRA